MPFVLLLLRVFAPLVDFLTIVLKKRVSLLLFIPFFEPRINFDFKFILCQILLLILCILLRIYLWRVKRIMKGLWSLKGMKEFTLQYQPVVEIENSLLWSIARLLVVGISHRCKNFFESSFKCYMISITKLRAVFVLLVMIKHWWQALHGKVDARMLKESLWMLILHFLDKSFSFES